MRLRPTTAASARTISISLLHGASAGAPSQGAWVDHYRELCIQAHGAGVALRNRVESERGQTAAEYMGILLVVAVIIGALIAADVDGKIAKAANTMVDKIAGGNGTR